MEILSVMEQMETDEEDRPKQDVTFISATVFVNPFREMAAEEQRKIDEDRLKAEKEANGPEESEFGSWYSNPAGMGAAGGDGGGVGKYMKQAKSSRRDDAGAPDSRPKKSSKSGGYGNFDAW